MRGRIERCGTCPRSEGHSFALARDLVLMNGELVYSGCLRGMPMYCKTEKLCVLCEVHVSRNF